MNRKRNDDVERGDENELSFDNADVRRAFMRKVFLILMAQLMCTAGLVCFIIFTPPVKKWMFFNRWLMWVSMGVIIVLMLAISCVESLRRRVPLNFILLSIFTVAQSIALGYVTAFTHPSKVLMALGITIAVVCVLVIFATQTKFDFTVCGTGLCIMMFLLMIVGVVAIFIPSKTFFLIYCSMGALLLSVYLIYDIQLMMGGNHAYSLSPEEYIFGALNLYVDIIVLFSYILGIIQSSD